MEPQFALFVLLDTTAIMSPRVLLICTLTKYVLLGLAVLTLDLQHHPTFSLMLVPQATTVCLVTWYVHTVQYSKVVTYTQVVMELLRTQSKFIPIQYK